MTTKAEKEHMRKLAELGCILCIEYYGKYGTPAEIHHIRRSGKRSNAPVIPLCPTHHRFPNTSIHGLGRRSFECRYGLTEEYLLDRSLELAYKPHP
jgi:hypothetical protein